MSLADFSLMIFVLFLWFGLYWGLNQWGNEKWGYLITSEDMVFETIPRDGNFVTTLISSDPVTLKESCTQNGDLDEWEFARYNAYFSLIAFTTIGYGDIHPSGRLQLIAGIEGFLGMLLVSLFKSFEFFS